MILVVFLRRVFVPRILQRNRFILFLFFSLYLCLLSTHLSLCTPPSSPPFISLCPFISYPSVSPSPLHLSPSSRLPSWLQSAGPPASAACWFCWSSPPSGARSPAAEAAAVRTAAPGRPPTAQVRTCLHLNVFTSGGSGWRWGRCLWLIGGHVGGSRVWRSEVTVIFIYPLSSLGAADHVIQLLSSTHLCVSVVMTTAAESNTDLMNLIHIRAVVMTTET